MWQSAECGTTVVHELYASRIYLEKECNDVAVCRVWHYGRSSMIRKSPKKNTTRYQLLLGALEITFIP